MWVIIDVHRPNKICQIRLLETIAYLGSNKRDSTNNWPQQPKWLCQTPSSPSSHHHQANKTIGKIDSGIELSIVVIVVDAHSITTKGSHWYSVFATRQSMPWWYDTISYATFHFGLVYTSQRPKLTSRYSSLPFNSKQTNNVMSLNYLIQITHCCLVGKVLLLMLLSVVAKGIA